MGSCILKQSKPTQSKAPQFIFKAKLIRLKEPKKDRLQIAIEIFKHKDLKTPTLILENSPLYQDRLRRFSPIESCS